MKRFFSYKVSQSLKIRGVIFDINVLIHQPSIPPSISSRITSNPSTATGYIPSLQLDYENISLNTQKSSESMKLESSSSSSSSSSSPYKYAAKLQRKLGNDAPIASILSSERTNEKESDAQILARVKTMSSSDSSSKSSSRWLLAPQIGDVLDYIGGRTIALGIIPTISTNSSLLSQLQHQVFEHKFFTPMNEKNDNTNNSSRDSNESQTIIKLYMNQLQSVEEKMAIKASEILIVSSDDHILEASRDNGYLSCRFRSPNALYGQITCDFVATSPIEIQDAVESMNGIALRNSVINSRVY